MMAKLGSNESVGSPVNITRRLTIGQQCLTWVTNQKRDAPLWVVPRYRAVLRVDSKWPENDGVSVGQDVDPAALAVKHHFSIGQRKQSVIFALAHILASVVFIAYLANQNAARSYLLATESLDAATLRIGVTSVSARALPFLMSHRVFL
jgi:hypothetical protein